MQRDLTLMRNRDAEVDEAFRRFAPDIYRIALSIVRDPQAAEDITQDTFTRAFDRFSSYDRRRPIAAWLHGIAVHAAIDHVRRSRRRRWLPLAGPVEVRLDDRRATDPGRRIEEREAVSALLDELPERTRAMLVLRHAYGYDDESTARLVGTSAGERAHPDLAGPRPPAGDPRGRRWDWRAREPEGAVSTGGRGREPAGDDSLGRLVADYVDAIEIPGSLTRERRRGVAVGRLGAGPRRPLLREAATAAGLVSAAAVLIAAVLLFRGAAPPHVAAPSALGTAATPHPATAAGSSAHGASASPVASSGGLAGPDLASEPWFVMSQFGGCPANAPAEPLSACSGGGGARPGSLDLSVGTLDGRVTLHVARTLPASAKLWTGRGSLPSASGPFGGRVLYWLYDGSRSELHAVEAATGADGLVLTTPDVVYNAVLDPASGTVYFGKLDAASRHDLGVWRVPLGGGGASELVAPAGHQYTGDRQWERSILLTLDGTRLVLRDCQGGTCTVAVREAADGALSVSAAVRDDAVLGLTDASLFGVFDCGGGCRVGGLDLATGGVAALSDDSCAASGSGTLSAGADGSTVLLVDAAPGCGAVGTVLAVDPTGGGTRAVWSPESTDPATGASLRLAARAEGVQGYGCPDGWFLVAPNGELAKTNQTGSLVPALVSLDGGRVIRFSTWPWP